MSLLFLWAHDASAQELSWEDNFASYSNVTAQFNINSSPAGSKVINQTLIAVYILLNLFYIQSGDGSGAEASNQGFWQSGLGS